MVIPSVPTSVKLVIFKVFCFPLNNAQSVNVNLPVFNADASGKLNTRPIYTD
jgi:hypothetical protein